VTAWAPSVGSSQTRASLNPFSIRGTVMQPNVLLMAKLVTLAFIVSEQIRLLSHHFVPFLGFFRHVGSPSAFHAALVLIFLFAAASLFLNRLVRTACVVLGGVIVVSIVSSMAYYENNREYAGLLLVLAGLEDPRGQARLLRWQVVLLYSAAAANKLLLADWRDGRFFDTWMNYLHHSAWAKTAGALSGRALGALLSWAAIVTEIVLAIGFALRRYLPVIIWVGIAYHTTLVLVMNRTFGMFWVAAASSYLAFVTWPVGGLIVRYGAELGRLGGVVALLRRLDLEQSFSWERGEKEGLEFSMKGMTYKGWSAVVWILLCNPLSYFALVVVAALPQPEPRVAALLGLVVLGAVAASVVADRGAVRRRRVSATAPGSAGA
jgi:hypothetical protein